MLEGFFKEKKLSDLLFVGTSRTWIKVFSALSLYDAEQKNLFAPKRFLSLLDYLVISVIYGHQINANHCRRDGKTECGGMVAVSL